MNPSSTPAVPLAFGNDMSRIVRGVAIILMVAGHTMPGHVISFAVPLFSFLAGYGYHFSRRRDWANSAMRCRHLLSHLWLVLFAVCLPAALATYPGKILPKEVVLNMFGLDGRLLYFTWYTYFYIVAMAVMPMLSRVIDRWGLAAVVFMSLALGCVAWGLDTHMSTLSKAQLRQPLYVYLQAYYRCCRYLPVVMGGYWLASSGVFARVRYSRSWWRAVAVAACAVGLYMLRGLPYAKALDIVWAPLAAVLLAMLFGMYRLAALRWLLTHLGISSMCIWFTHALFFTRATRDVFLPLVAWIPAGWLRVVPILLLSWAMAIAVARVHSALGAACSRAVDAMRRRNLLAG